LEPSHAIAKLGGLARQLGEGKKLLLLLSGRGDKDLETIATAKGVEL
jgi:tryptophan synthase beta chain